MNETAASLRGPEPELDLAFSVDAGLDRGLRAAAGALAEQEAGEGTWGSLLAGWLADLAAETPAVLRRPAYSLGLELCDDARIAELNLTWRDSRGPTDVLAFAAQEEAPPQPWSREPPHPSSPEGGSPAGAPLELGDIVISLETAARQAIEQNHPLERELRFLASHGLLHLLGWDHPSEHELAAMLERQERLLASSRGRS
jgi:probable rRNA maturation factor